MTNLNVADWTLPAPCAFHEVPHMVMRDRQPDGVLWQWLLQDLWIARGNPPTTHKDPLVVVAIKLDSVFAAARAKELCTTCVGVADLEFRMAIVTVRRLRRGIACTMNFDGARVVHPQTPL